MTGDRVIDPKRVTPTVSPYWVTGIQPETETVEPGLEQRLSLQPTILRGTAEWLR